GVEAEERRQRVNFRVTGRWRVEQQLYQTERVGTHRRQERIFRVAAVKAFVEQQVQRLHHRTLSGIPVRDVEHVNQCTELLQARPSSMEATVDGWRLTGDQPAVF